MNRRLHQALLILRITSDLAMVAMAWAGAYVLRFYSGFFPVFKGLPGSVLYLKLIPFILVIYLGIFAASGFYARTGRHRSAFTEALDIIQSSILAILGVIAFSYFYEEYRYSRLTIFLFAGIQIVLVICNRSLLRKLLRRYRRRRPPRETLIIGSEEGLLQALQLSFHNEIFRINLRGVIPVGTSEQVASTEKKCQELRLPILAQQKDWPTFFSQHPMQTVIFALPHNAYQFLQEHFAAIVNQVGDVKLIPDILRYTRLAAGIDLVDGLPIISVHDSPLIGIGSVIKRLMDIAGAAFALLAFSPVMATIALTIRLTSPGPIFYRQERMGLDGRTFNILKFRSMPIDAESQTGAVWASEEDNRATWFGKMIRRTSMDELPQLFNVLRGEMSLVGPRPERPVFVDQFRRKVPGYMLRHNVKAGLTGWAQVNGWRGNTSLERRIEFDLFYIQNWSVWLDVRILFLTVFEVLFGRNAY